MCSAAAAAGYNLAESGPPLMIINLWVLSQYSPYYTTLQYSSLHSCAAQCTVLQRIEVFYRSVKYCTVQCSVAQYCTVQCSVAQYRRVQFSVAQYCRVQCSVAQYCRVQCSAGRVLSASPILGAPSWRPDQVVIATLHSTALNCTQLHPTLLNYTQLHSTSLN